MATLLQMCAAGGVAGGPPGQRSRSRCASTATGNASEPVPAVVGTATTGRTPCGTRFSPEKHGRGSLAIPVRAARSIRASRVARATTAEAGPATATASVGQDSEGLAAESRRTPDRIRPTRTGNRWMPCYCWSRRSPSARTCLGLCVRVGRAACRQDLAAGLDQLLRGWSPCPGPAPCAALPGRCSGSAPPRVGASDRHRVRKCLAAPRRAMPDPGIRNDNSRSTVLRASRGGARPHVLRARAHGPAAPPPAGHGSAVPPGR